MILDASQRAPTMLYVDKYRPKDLSELHYHPHLTEQLEILVRQCVLTQAASEDVPHMLFYGPSGAGKKTRITCLLKALYGPGALKARPATNHSSKWTSVSF